MSAPGQPAHNRKYSEYARDQVLIMRINGRSYRWIAKALGVTYSTVARMARGEWGAKTLPRLVKCKHCPTMLVRRTKKAGPCCKPCHWKYRTIRGHMARRYFAMRDLFGFTDQEFQQFMLLCRRALRKEEDIVIQAIMLDLRDP